MNADEVPGYRDIITHPMDLGTMEQRIQDGYYTTMDLFQHDFMLVTQNAQRFNPPSSIYHTAARRLETWGLRAIAREAMSVVRPDPARDESPSEPRRRGHRKRSMHESMLLEAEPNSEHLSRRMMRIGSARSTTWSLQDVDTTDPDELLFRRTLAYAGVSQTQLTGKSACSARVHAKPKPRLAPVSSAARESRSAPKAVEDTETNFVYRDDGAIDAAEISDVHEYFGRAAREVPIVESLQHLPMTLSAAPAPGNAAAEASLVFPPGVAGCPDALYNAMAREPHPPSDNMSHTFEGTHVPADQRVLPFLLAATPGPAGLGQGSSASASAGPSASPLSLRPVWPAPPPPSIQEAGLRLNRRERELEQERDEQNWTFFRPHLQRLLAMDDVGLYGNMPSWAAQAGDERTAQPYASVAGARLHQTVRDYLRTMAYRALQLPRTAQYVPRTSLQQLPAALQVSMLGAQESERLIDTVYGSVEGLAYVRSLADFVAGAAAEDPAAEVPIAGLDATLSDYVKQGIVRPMTGGLHGLLEKVGASLAPLMQRDGLSPDAQAPVKKEEDASPAPVQ